MHARLRLQPPVGVGPLDLQGRRLDPRLFPGCLFDDLDVHAVGVGPAAVHALQHLGPVLGLGAAGAGVDLDVAVVAIGLARQQRLQLRPRGQILQPPQLDDGLLEGGLIALGVGQFREVHGVGHARLELLHRLDLSGEAVALAHQGLGLLGPVPEGGILRTCVQLVEPPERRIPVKDAS